MTTPKPKTDSPIPRRSVLLGVAGGSAAPFLSSTPAAAAAHRSGEPEYGGWFDDVDNYQETVERTGQDRVRITVGARGNGGDFAFDPPAARIDPGTTVVWEWSGNGGVHDVVAEDGRFRSELTDESGFTFEYTFDGTGIVKYACAPHEPMGMKGALVVGSPSSAATTESSLEDLLAIGGGLGLASLLYTIFVIELRSQARTTNRKFTRQMR